MYICLYPNASLFARFVSWVQISSGLSPPSVQILTHPAAVAAAKALVSQMFYETASASTYLALQAKMRGEGWKVRIKILIYIGFTRYRVKPDIERLYFERICVYPFFNIAVI